MDKIKEKYWLDDDLLIIKKTHDATPMLQDAQYARETTEHKFGSDYKHVGQVSTALLAVWLKEAGVAWTDSEGIRDVLKKKLMSNEFSGLRNWEGSF